MLVKEEVRKILDTHNYVDDNPYAKNFPHPPCTYANMIPHIAGKGQVEKMILEYLNSLGLVAKPETVKEVVDEVWLEYRNLPELRK